MDAAWRRLTDCARGKPATPHRAGAQSGGARRRRAAWRAFPLPICARSRWRRRIIWRSRGNFHTVLIDHIPVMAETYAQRGAALCASDRYALRSEGVKLICSAAAAPDALYPDGDGADAFRRTASRLAEMQSEDYLQARARYFASCDGIVRMLENMLWACGFRPGLHSFLSLRACPR